MSVHNGRFALAMAATAVLALATGCGSGKSSGSSTTGKASAAAAGGDGCVANAVKSTEGGFCLVTPPGSKAIPAANSDANNRNYSFLDGNGNGVNIDVSKLTDIETWDWTVKAYQAQSTNTDRSQQQSGDVPGGGKFWFYVQGDRTRVDVITHKGNTLFLCNTIGEKPDQPTIDSCKSVRPL